MGIRRAEVAMVTMKINQIEIMIKIEHGVDIKAEIKVETEVKI